MALAAAAAADAFAGSPATQRVAAPPELPPLSQSPLIGCRSHEKVGWRGGVSLRQEEAEIETTSQAEALPPQNERVGSVYLDS